MIGLKLKELGQASQFSPVPVLPALPYADAYVWDSAFLQGMGTCAVTMIERTRRIVKICML